VWAIIRENGEDFHNLFCSIGVLDPDGALKRGDYTLTDAGETVHNLVTINDMNNKQTIFNWIFATLRESAWAPLGVFGFYLLGLAFGLFKMFPPLDIPTHFMGGVAITYFFRSAIKHSQKFLGDIPSLIQIVFAFTCTGTTIILWEFYENAFDYFFGTTMVRGLEDTVVDMFVGMLGGLVLSFFYKQVK
jgi:hypothetical protein